MLDNLVVAHMTSLMMGFLSFAPYSNDYLHLVSKSCVPMLCLKGGRPSFVSHYFVMEETDLGNPIRKAFWIIKKGIQEKDTKVIKPTRRQPPVVGRMSNGFRFRYDFILYLHIIIQIQSIKVDLWVVFRFLSNNVFYS